MFNASNILFTINIPTDIAVPEYVSISFAQLFDSPFIVINPPVSEPNQFNSGVTVTEDKQTVKYFFNRSSTAWKAATVTDVLLLSLKNLVTAEDNQVTVAICKTAETVLPVNKLLSSVKIKRTQACNLSYNLGIVNQTATEAGLPRIVNRTDNQVVGVNEAAKEYEIDINHYVSKKAAEYYNTYNYTLLNDNGLRDWATVVSIGAGQEGFTARPVVINLKGKVPRRLVLDLKLFNNYIPFRLIDIKSVRNEAGSAVIITDWDAEENTWDYNVDFNSDFRKQSTSYLHYDSIRKGSFNNDHNFDFDRLRSSALIFEPDHSNDFWNQQGAQAIIFYTIQYEGKRTSNYLIIKRN